MDILQTGSSGDSDLKRKWGKWVARIEARKKVFEQGWWKQAKQAEEMYNIRGDQTPERNPFNILYANTDVLLPSLYSASPRPDVLTRSKLGRQDVAKAAEAFCVSFVDMNTPGKETFDDAMGSAVLSALVPGMGYVRIRVYPDETCPIRAESGSYRDLIWGKAQKWSRVPWIAFAHTMTKEDVISRFKLSPEQQAKLKVPTQQQADENTQEKGPDEPTIVYELWLKAERRIVFLCDGYEDTLLDASDDELKLPGFFPTPGPLYLIKKPGDLEPTTPYEYYRNQAEELNRVTVRLNKVLSAIRVRGAYNPLLGDDIKNILSDDQMENALVPSSIPMDLTGKGFESHIWLLPLEKLIQVAKELYVARVQIMSVIQQITGLSDIVRGSTAASETATAQELKNKWGTIRLKQMQRIVALYVRDLLRLGVNAGAQALDEGAWKQMTQLPLPTAEEKQQVLGMLQEQAQAAAQAAEQAQMMGMQPPPPPQPDPQLVEKAQMASWQEVIDTLRDDQGRAYTIDIETNTTLDVDATADKQEVAEFMATLGQLVSGIAPLIEMGPSGVEAAKELLIAVTNKFKFGREVKESLMKLQTPPPQEDPELKARMAELQAESAMKKEEHQMKMEVEREKLRIFKEKSAMELELARAKFQIEMAKLNAGLQADQMQIGLDHQRMQMEEQHMERQSQLDGQQMEKKAQFESQAMERKAEFSERESKNRVETNEALSKQKLAAVKQQAKAKPANSPKN